MLRNRQLNFERRLVEDLDRLRAPVGEGAGVAYWPGPPVWPTTQTSDPASPSCWRNAGSAWFRWTCLSALRNVQD